VVGRLNRQRSQVYQEKFRPVLRIQVDLKCTGTVILFLPVKWMGGGHAELSLIPLLESEFHVTTLLGKVLHGNLPYS
jgi:hypothetical protein